MDLSQKLYPTPLDDTVSEEYVTPPPQLQQQQRVVDPSASPEAYRFPISSASFIHSTPNHQYYRPEEHGHYFLSQGHEGDRYNPMYGQPSPLFRGNSHMTPFPETTFEGENLNYASQFLDGMHGQQRPAGKEAKEKFNQPPKGRKLRAISYLPFLSF